MTKLYLELNSSLPEVMELEDFSHLLGIVADGSRLSPAQCELLPAPVVALTGSSAIQDEWCEQQDILRIVDHGLDACARLRDEMPELDWMPRLVVSKPETIFRMTDSPGEGFSFYSPDTSAIRGYRVADNDLPLIVVLKKARELGFERIWLHASDAAARGDGLELDLLDKAREYSGDGVWISGGATQPRHLENLARDGGASAVVIDPTLLTQAGIEILAAALQPTITTEIPVSCCGLTTDN